MNKEMRNKSFALIFAALMIASVSAIMMPVEAQEHGGVAIGTAQTPTTGGPVPAGVTPNTTIQTIAYLSFSPNPIGVGQQLLVNLWLQPALQVNRAHTGYTVVITKPDGTTETVGPLVSYQADTTAWFTYVPDVAGNYSLQFFFAGDYYPAGYYYQGQLLTTQQQSQIIVSAGTSTNTGFNTTQSVYYAPSQTQKYSLVVQQDQVSSWPASALPGPGQYWIRPISPDNREWWVIGGNVPNNEVGGGTGTPGWPDNTNIYSSNYKFIPYVTGPTSAHVVWRQLGALDGIFGGLIDGAYTTAQAPDVDFAGAAFTFGMTGPGNGGNPSIAFDGRIYNTITKQFDGVTQSVWECSDIRTGQVYWDLTNVAHPPTYISYAENAPPVPGGLGRTDRTTVSLLYLGSNLVTKYNPITGAITLNVSIPNLSSSTLYADPYVLSIQDLGASQGANRYHLINWTLQGLSTNLTAFATANVISNITFPFSSIGTADFETMISIQSTSSSPIATGVASDVQIMGVSLTSGKLLWNESTGIGYPIFSGLGLADHGKYANRFDDGHFYCWDEQTGKFLWTSEISSLPWGTFGSYQDESAYGLIFYNQYDGIVAYNWNTGKVAFHYEAPSTDFETPYLTNGVGNPENSSQGQSFFSGSVIADGMVYTYAVEHSPTAPLTRGWQTYAVNATTGALVWKTLGSMIPGVVADGYLTATNYYDGYMYVFGMGQSSTTVQAPLNQITTGQSVTIAGTVLDKSPFTSNVAPYAPGTVPAVSDASMGDFMAYLFQQFPCPANLTGVLVSIDAIDPNGNPVHIATPTSVGSTGAFGATWTPTIAGQYTITATFAGTDSYGYSMATTFATVTQAPASPTTAPTTTQAAGVTMSDFAIFLIAAVIAIIIAIAVVGALILRKHA